MFKTNLPGVTTQKLSAERGISPMAAGDTMLSLFESIANGVPWAGWSGVIFGWSISLKDKFKLTRKRFLDYDAWPYLDCESM